MWVSLGLPEDVPMGEFKGQLYTNYNIFISLVPKQREREKRPGISTACTCAKVKYLS